MAVFSTVKVRRTRFQGFTDPRLPIGSWFAQQSALGDATGGANLLAFVFSASTSRDYNLYNIERLTGSIDPLVGPSELAAAMLSAQNMSQDIDVTDTFHSLGLSFSDNGVGVTPRQSLRGDSLGFLPMWLGAKGIQSIESRAQVEIENVLGRAIAMRLEGYIWSTRSVMSDGGPQRPLGGRFGHA